ncbi:MAG: MFS transporter [Candidatus Yanofskybacteria bacterium]|nr:MFS transporter [Candidatus Yanofskybacteria bacterium]
MAMSTSRKHTSQLTVLVLTVFLDMLGVSLVIPVAAPLFLGPDGGIFGPLVPLDYRTLILGFLLGTAPIVQFFSAPLLGAYADRAGRKPVLTLSVLATGLGHVLFGMGILSQQIWLLFVSRALAGAGAGNISAANSAMADVSDDTSKVRNFGLIGMAIGLGLIFGPYLGGQLSDPSVAPWFTYATPLWIAAGLSALNALVIQLFFRETLVQAISGDMDVLTGVRNIVRAFTMPTMRTMYLVSLLFGFGYNFFTQFFSVFLIARFQFSSSEIGVLFAYVGLWIALSQGLLARFLSRLVRPSTVVHWAPLATAAVLLVLAGVHKVHTVYLLLPAVAAFYGLNSPNVTALISDLADRQSQGEALGINQSMSALSFGIPPIIAGIVSTVNVALPMILAAVFMLVAWFIFVRFHYQRTRPLFHEVE